MLTDDTQCRTPSAHHYVSVKGFKDKPLFGTWVRLAARVLYHANAYRDT